MREKDRREGQQGRNETDLEMAGHEVNPIA